MGKLLQNKNVKSNFTKCLKKSAMRRHKNEGEGGKKTPKKKMDNPSFL